MAGRGQPISHQRDCAKGARSPLFNGFCFYAPDQIRPDGVGRILELWKTIGRSSQRTKFLSFPQRDMNLRELLHISRKLMIKLEINEPEIPEFWVSVSVVEFQPLEKVEK